MPPNNYGKPSPSTIEVMDWAQDLDDLERPFATIMFGIATNNPASIATAYALLEASPYLETPSKIQFDDEWGPHIGTITSLEYDEHAIKEWHLRGNQQVASYHQLRADNVGKFFITISPFPGCEELSTGLVKTMAERHFYNQSDAFRIPQKMGGWKLTNIGSRKFGIFVSDPRAGPDTWPIRLRHPNDQRQQYYYQLDSRLDRLCPHCHRHACSKSKHTCKGWREQQARKTEAAARLHSIDHRQGWLDTRALHSNNRRVQSYIQSKHS